MSEPHAPGQQPTARLSAQRVVIHLHIDTAATTQQPDGDASDGRMPAWLEAACTPVRQAMLPAKPFPKAAPCKALLRCCCRDAARSTVARHIHVCLLGRLHGCAGC